MADILLPDTAVAATRAASGHHRLRLLIGSVLLAAIAIAAIAAPLLAPHDPYAQDLSRRLLPPVWEAAGTWLNPFGTDTLGRDYLSRLIYGARISLLIGVAVVVMSGCLGLIFGLLSGYFGGAIDTVITFIVTTRLAMPVVLIALAAVAIGGGSLLTVVLVLGLLKWDRFAVVTRSAVRQIRVRDYVAAAEAAGYSTTRILLNEILPNVLPQFVVIAALEMASAIVLEASLSFLGLGVPPPLPSWGLMIAEAKPHMLFDFRLIAIPGVALTLLILAITMIGDNVRTGDSDRA